MSAARANPGGTPHPAGLVSRIALSEPEHPAFVTAVTPTSPSVIAAHPASALSSGAGLPQVLRGTDLLAVPVGQGGEFGGSARDLATPYGVDLAQVIKHERVKGSAGEVVRVPVQAPEGWPGRLLLVGVGAATHSELRRAGAALARVAKGRTRLATTVAAGGGAEVLRGFVEGLVLGAYVPPRAGIAERRDHPVAHIDLYGSYPPQALERGLAHAHATWRARDLAATPATVKTPGWLAQQSIALAPSAGLNVTVWDEPRLAEEGFGGLLAVGAGSATAPRFVQLEYSGPSGSAAASSKPVVLVGKGVTFDTGGLSIKPREAMTTMKTDMSGAAVVLSVLAACRAVGVRRRVIGLLPLAENAFGASSYRPGDIVTHFGGMTSEVVNTDAEGRMLLADALAFADARLDPAVLVDVATLTGAATLGLGKRHAALYATDDALAAALERASQASGEKVWRMPLVEDYRPSLDSDIADLRHVSTDGKIGGGSIVAALFLREFTGGRRWAHLDIAGPGRAERDENEVTKGATGYGARLLLRWLESLR